MIRIITRLALLLACCVLGLTTTAQAQEFQKTYRLPANGSISVKNVSGNIIVNGYDGDAVMVAAFKEGTDRDKVEVIDTSSGERVELSVRYAEDCNCNASIRFEVRVPRSISYNIGHISTASGDIEIRNVRGNIKASTASGDVAVRDVVGEVNASTASGDVDVQISRLEGNGSMKFSSASGDVSVKMPSDLDAEVKMSTVTGKVTTDFPIEVRTNQYGPGSTARGQLGGASRSLSISSASGDVSLMRIGSNL